MPSYANAYRVGTHLLSVSCYILLLLMPLLLMLLLLEIVFTVVICCRHSKNIYTPASSTISCGYLLQYPKYVESRTPLEASMLILFLINKALTIT